MDKKKIAALIVAGQPPEGETAEADESAEMEEGLDAAVEEILGAIESKDPAALKAALKSFVSMCY